MKRILLIRHPEIAGAEQLRYFGNTDVELSERGYKQAEQMLKYLSPRKVKSVYCSQLQRAKHPAQLLAEKLKLKLNVVPGLCEVNFGRWEGKSFQEMLDEDENLYRAWLGMAPEFGFPEGETLGEFYRRVMREYNNILSADNNHPQSEGLDVLLTHGGVIKLILADLLGIEWGKVNNIKQDFGALNLIEYKDGYGVLRLMNDTCYLGSDGCHGLYS
jgi:broad specificity phosphatase PhoE